MFLPALRPQSLSPPPASAVAARSGAASRAPSNRRGPNYFPDVPVIDQNGRTMKFYDDVIKGKIVVISFIYTNCQDICPLTTARMAQVADKLGDVMGRDLFFISMTVDPENDTPERMKAFADAYDVGPGWLFLTGKLDDIRAINFKLGDRSDRSLSQHRNEIVLGNDATGDWQRASVFGDLDSLVISIRQMNPKWLDQVHVPGRDQVSNAAFPLSKQPGQALFRRLCAPCHTIGAGDRVGPDLRDVTARRDRAWLKSFISDPRKMFAAKDPTALALAAKFPAVRMPALRISDIDADDLLSYLDAESARITNSPAGSAPQARNHQH
jgi:cytochrome oxidase Cu insertion factor (SCO1/SenC/PrrC family)/mono/diheme cytochrome c family protein